MHPTEQKAYSVWNMATLARKRNHGSRVDFLLAGRPDPPTQDSAALSGEEEVRTAILHMLPCGDWHCCRQTFSDFAAHGLLLWVAKATLCLAPEPDSTWTGASSRSV
jgi:hypothetical protein